MTRPNTTAGFIGVQAVTPILQSMLGIVAPDEVINNTLDGNGTRSIPITNASNKFVLSALFTGAFTNDSQAPSAIISGNNLIVTGKNGIPDATKPFRVVLRTS